MKPGIFILLLSLLTLSSLQTQPLQEVDPDKVGISSARLQKIDDFISKYMDEGTMPGGVFLIARKGKVAYFKSHGYLDTSEVTRYEQSDIFRLASMTKAVTTVAILQLYENGKLGLDDPIHHYIPAFEKMEVLDQFNEEDSTYTTRPAEHNITIRHLLTHSSGITYATFNPGAIQYLYTKYGLNEGGLYHASLDTEAFVNKIAKTPLIFEPGEQYMYGLNMEVLGRIVEVISGQELDVYFQQNIFEPVGMHDTYFHLPAEKQERLVPIYSFDDSGNLTMMPALGDLDINNYPTIKDNNHYAGGGGLSGTTIDYARFIQTLMDDLLHNKQVLLSRNTIELMRSDQFIRLNEKGKGYSKIPGISYGLGFEIRTQPGESHSPKSAGTFEWGGYFNTKYFIDPHEELIFVGMTQILPFYRQDFWTRLYAMIYASVLE